MIEAVHLKNCMAASSQALLDPALRQRRCSDCSRSAVYWTRAILPACRVLKQRYTQCSNALQVADIEKAEREKMREKVNHIIGHGINCFINRQVWGVWQRYVSY